MKTRYILLSPVALGVTAFAGALLDTYDDSKPPALSLPAAYQRVYAALGPLTNQFHCVSATITTNYSAEGQWFFIFCTTNKPPTLMRITIDFSGREVRVHNPLPLERPRQDFTPNKSPEPTGSGASF